MKKIAFIVFLICVSCLSLAAQSTMRIYDAELSIPFGESKGKIVAINSDFIFVASGNSEESFSIQQANINAITYNSGVMIVESNEPVISRNQLGRRLAFKISSDGARDIESWMNSKVARSSTAGGTVSPVVSTAKNGEYVYQAKHDHRVYGSCTGRLVFTDDRVSFESTDDRDHSRQWLYTDIKQLKSKSPYSFSVKPLTGDGISLEILGSGIDVLDFKGLQDKVALSKARR